MLFKDGIVIITISNDQAVKFSLVRNEVWEPPDSWYSTCIVFESS